MGYADMRKQTVYRDRQSGKFVRKETWKRSKRQGGKRYKREIIEIQEEETWIITFKYPR